MLTLNPVRVHAAAIQTAAARVHRSKNITTTKFGCRALLAFALSAAFISSAAAQSLTPIRFTLDFKHQGIHAWYYVAQEKGYFRAEGLDVKIDQGEGSAATITRIMSGAYDAGFGDMNAIIQMAAAKPGEAQSRGANVATNSTLKSMGLSRAAGALGELKADTIAQSQIGDDWTLYSGRASCSAGIELLGHEIVVIGMSKNWSGPLIVDHAVMADAIDIEPVRAAIQRLGFAAKGQLTSDERGKLVAVIARR